MKPKKILVVEDDKVIQKLFADILKAAGYEVLTANDSASALKLACEQEPDLVTLDIELPKDSPNDNWDGFSVAGWLRRLHEGKPKPILIVISKPVEKKQLLNAVAEALKS
jgi:two-component system OmpR family response regulator